MKLSITKRAWSKMKDVIKKEKSESFMLSAISGGCNGFNYDLKLINKKNFDSFINTKIKPMIIENDDTKLLVDPIAEMILLGTKIDYVSEDYSNGIFENKFIFTPDKNRASSCGCGISFNPKE
uniref:Core domain-containing protein n=1 Tax=viral metagenome TaxID=1070528 RepID=A0A6C0F8S2_9ZZZZ|tara:strand:- start:6924 stop:7292 length:369 start_codon:yes stop_codon:yes gene_type:complete